MLQKSKTLSTAKIMPLASHNLRKQTKKLAISTHGKIDLIQTDKILFLKSDSNYTEIHLLDGRVLITSCTLKKYESKLNASMFMRVHQSYMIQRAQIKTFLPQQHKLILHHTQEIPVSRSKKEELMKYLKSLMV